MTFVVTSNCDNCRFTHCTVACPVDAFHGDAAMLYIDPAECIDCGACVPECPVEAIFPDTAIPPGQEEWLDINRERSSKLPIINDVQAQLAGASARCQTLGFSVA